MFLRTGERHEDMLLGQRFTPQNSEVRKHLIHHVGFASCFDLETSTNTEKESGFLEGDMRFWLLVLSTGLSKKKMSLVFDELPESKQRLDLCDHRSFVY